MAKKRGSTVSPKAAKVPPSAALRAPEMDAWERTAWVCLHLLVIVVPIAMSNLGPFSPGGIPLTFDQFDIVKVVLQRGLLLIGFGAWLGGILMRGGKVRFTKVEWLILAFVAWVALTTVLAVHPPTALFGKYRRFEGLLSFITYAGVFFLALQLVDRPSRVRSLARSLAIGGFLVGAYGLTQVAGTVPLGFARILFPASLGIIVAGTIGLGYLALQSSKSDRETSLACTIGAAFVLLGGAFFAAGLNQNIQSALGQGLSVVSLDPVRWGSLPFEANRAFSTFGNPDLLGGYLIFPWAAALGLALSEEHRLWRGIYWAFTMLNVVIGLTSYVRGAWIGATIAAIVLVIAYRRVRAGTGERLKGIDRVFLGGSSVLALVVVVWSSLSTDAVRNVLARIASIFQFSEGSAFTRFQIWQAAIAAIEKRPIFGWGADTFRLLFPMFKTPEYVEAAGYLSVADNVHNYPLQLATGIGIPGVLLLYGLVVVVLVVAARHVFAKGAGTARLVYGAFWAAVVGYIAHLMFGLSVTGSTVLMWLSFGVLLGPAARALEVRRPRAAAALAALLALAVLVGVVLDVRYAAADNHYLRGRVTTQGLDSIRELEKAIELNPYNEMYRLELASAWQYAFQSAALTYAQSVASGAPDEAARQQALTYLATAEEKYLAVVAYVPQEYDTYVFFADLYNRAAAYIDVAYAEKAVAIATEGVAVEKYGPAIRLQRGAALISLGRYDEAIEDLAFAIKLDPAFRAAYLPLAQAYEQTGDIAGARRALTEMLGRYPGDADALAALAALESTGGAAQP